jgi:hypothetical protein
MRSLCLVFLMLCSAAATLHADDHFVYSRTAYYAGRMMGPKQMEIWLTSDRAYVNDGKTVTIYRLDLRKVWTLAPGGKKYIESDLSDTLSVLPPSLTRVSYEWSIHRGNQDTVLYNLLLQHYRLTGDAETSEINADVWVPEKTSGEIARYCNTHFKPFFFLYVLGWKALTDSIALFQSNVIAQAKWNAILGQLTGSDEFTLVKYEAADSPPGVYELPTGAERVTSYKELRP